jgi:hypothetical protein
MLLKVQDRYAFEVQDRYAFEVQELCFWSAGAMLLECRSYAF